MCLTPSELLAIMQEKELGPPPKQGEVTNSSIDQVDSEFDRALTLIEEAYTLLGFLGDTNLAGLILDYDRRNMRRLAAKLKEFADKYEEPDAI